jgi:hypothetical protein
MSRSKALNIDRDKKRGLGAFQRFTPIPDIVGPISYSGEADEWLHRFGLKPPYSIGPRLSTHRRKIEGRDW